MVVPIPAIIGDLRFRADQLIELQARERGVSSYLIYDGEVIHNARAGRQRHIGLDFERNRVHSTGWDLVVREWISHHVPVHYALRVWVIDLVFEDVAAERISSKDTRCQSIGEDTLPVLTCRHGVRRTRNSSVVPKLVEVKEEESLVSPIVDLRYPD